jgi:hypothetical protein
MPFYYIISLCVADRIFDFVIVVFVGDCKFEYFVVYDKMINCWSFERKFWFWYWFGESSDDYKRKVCILVAKWGDWIVVYIKGVYKA